MGCVSARLDYSSPKIVWLDRLLGRLVVVLLEIRWASLRKQD